MVNLKADIDVNLVSLFTCMFYSPNIIVITYCGKQLVFNHFHLT